MYDKDGTFIHSETISIKQAKCNCFEAFPHPARDYLLIRGNNLSAVSLVDVSARTALLKKLSAESIYRLNVGNLEKGFYTLIIKDKNGETQVEKIIIY